MCIATHLEIRQIGNDVIRFTVFFNYVATFLGVSAHRFATLALVVILVAHLACESFSFCAQQSGRLMQAIRTNRRVPRAGGCGWRM